jgi:hypothetical protein
LSIYNIPDQVVPVETNVIFSNNKTVVGDCSHIPGSTDIYVWKTGYYQIFFNLMHIEPCQFTLFLNGAPVNGTVIGSPTGSAQNSLTIIFEIGPADLEPAPVPGGIAALLQVRNHTSFPPAGVTLSGVNGSGTSVGQINAVFSLFLLLPAAV